MPELKDTLGIQAESQAYEAAIHQTKSIGCYWHHEISAYALSTGGASHACGHHSLESCGMYANDRATAAYIYIYM